MKIVIFANGRVSDYRFAWDSMKGCAYVIACDGGMLHTFEMGIQPDCIIGDFDSTPPDILENYITRGVNRLTYPPDKDETDLALCMSHALDRHPSSVVVMGATGRRFDHTLANSHVLIQAVMRGVPAELLDSGTRVRVINKDCVLQKSMFETVSLIPMTTEVTGVVTRGLKYPLCGEKLSVGSTRGVSNMVVEDEAYISIESGLLLIIEIKE